MKNFLKGRKGSFWLLTSSVLGLLIFGVFAFTNFSIGSTNKEVVQIVLNEYNVQSSETVFRVGTTYEFVATNNGYIGHEVMLVLKDFPGKEDFMNQVATSDHHGNGAMGRMMGKARGWWDTIMGNGHESMEGEGRNRGHHGSGAGAGKGAGRNAIRAASHLIAPGQQVTFTYTPTKEDIGQEWELACYVAGHYHAGMHIPVVIQ